MKQIVLLPLYFLASGALAQTKWNIGGTGDWNTAGNWNPATVPNGAGVQAEIGEGAGNGGTAQISTAVPGIRRFWLAEQSSETGTLDILPGGSLSTLEAGTAPTYIAVRGTGTLNMTGGSLNVGGELRVAGIGSTPVGVVNQSAGTVTANTLATNTHTYIARDTGTGTWNLSGTGSATFQNNLYVGNSGTGLFKIDGTTATFAVQNDLRIGELNGSDGEVDQNGSAATAGRLVIGRINGATGTYDISSGTLGVTGDTWAGHEGDGTLKASGDSVVTLSRLFVGFRETGLLDVSGTADVNITGDLRIGEEQDAAGTLTQSGGTINANRIVTARTGNTTADLDISSGALTSAGNTWIGHDGTATLDVSGTADVNVGGDLRIGENNGAQGDVTQTGGTVDANRVILGRQTGATGTYDISSGALTTSGESWAGHTGDGSLKASGDAVVNMSKLSVSLNNNSDGLLEVSGTADVNISGDIRVGEFSGSDGIVNVGGGTLDVGRFVAARFAGSESDVNISGGTLTSNGDAWVSFAGTGTTDVSGTGALHVNGNLNITNAGSGVGTLTVSGGTLRADHIWGRTGNDTFNVSGGTIAPLDASNGVIHSDAPVTLTGSGATFSGADLGGTGRLLQIWGAIGESGGSQGFTTSGPGTVEIIGAGANTFTGTVTHTSGDLRLDKTANGTTAVGGDILVQGGRLIWDEHNQVADSSTITQTGGQILLNNRTETIANLTRSGGTMGTGGTGNLTVTDTLAVSGGGNLDINSSAGVVTANSVVYTGGTINVGGGGGTLNVGPGGLTIQGRSLNLDNNNSRVVLSGDITTLASATTAEIDERLNTNFNAGFGLDLNNAQRTVTVADGAAAADLDIGVVVTDSGTGGGITKAGPGTLLLSTDQGNTYTGPTLMLEGALLAVNTAGSATGTGPVDVMDGAILGGTGTIGTVGSTTDTTTIFYGGSISPGDDASAGLFGVGTLDFLGDLDIQGSLLADIEGAGVSDLLQVTGADLSLSSVLGGNVALDPLDAFNRTHYWLASLDTGTVSGAFSNAAPSSFLDAAFGTTGAQFVSVDGQAFALYYAADRAGDGSILGYSGGNDLLLIAIPEPSRAAFLLLGAIALLGRRRR